MLRRSGLEQLLGCMRMSLFVSASGASGEIYRLRKARAQAESGASEGNRDAKRQRCGLAGFVRRGEISEEDAPAQYGLSSAIIEAKTPSRKYFGFNHACISGTRSIEESLSSR